MASDYEDDDGADAWTWAALEPEPTERERALLDLFCREFLVDGNATLAASRCGFQAAFAQEYGKRFFQRSYVQRRLEQLRQSTKDDKAEKAYMRNVVVNTLHKVATDEYQKGAARVSAARELSAIYGFATPANKPSGSHKGGVIMVPAIANLEDWEAAAQASQGALAEASRVE